MIKKFMLSIFLFLHPITIVSQTIQQVANEIKKKEIKFKKTALAIACHESANGKSKIFKTKLNAFGIVSKTGGYERFNSISSSVIRFKKIHDRVIEKYRPKTEKQFLLAVCRYGYAEDKNYFHKVYRYFKQFNSDLRKI